MRVGPLKYFAEIESTQGIVFRDQTHAMGRNIHKSDPLTTIWRALGLALMLMAAIATIWGFARYGVDTRLARPAGSGCCFGALVEPRQTCGRCARCWSQRADREAGRDTCAGADELTSINGSIEAHALVLLCWHG